MKTLEDLIRDAVARGDFTHLSLASRWDDKGFNASFAPAKGFGCHFTTDKDPVEALRTALSQVRARKSAPDKVQKPNAEPTDAELQQRDDAAKRDDMDFG